MNITSVNNLQIKNLIKLRKSVERKKQGLIIIEGHHELEIAVMSGLQIKDLYYSKNFNKSNLTIPDSLNQNKIEVSENVFEKIAFRENPDGFLATAVLPKTDLNQIKLKKNSLVIVLEAVEKPGNLGAILRTADAVGADAFIISDPKTDIYNQNVIRSSLGTVFSNQIGAGANTEVLEWLHANKIKTIAATPDTDKIYTNSDFRGPAAIIIGTEHEGLSDFWLTQADEKIKIPMNGKIDSLNASVSAGVILFEAFRQRAKKS